MSIEEITVSLEVRPMSIRDLPGAQTVETVLTDVQYEQIAAMFGRMVGSMNSAALGHGVALPEREPAEPGQSPREWSLYFESGSTVSFSGGPPTPILGGEMRGRFGCGCDWCQAVARRTLPPLPSDEAARTALEGEILAYATPAEVAAVRAHLRAGKVYNTYGDCVIAIIAALRGETYHSVQLGPPVHLGLRTPVFERWLGELPRGATPESDETAAKLDAWLTDWLARQGVADDIEPAEPPPLPARPTLQQILTARRYTFHPERGLTLRE